MPSTACATWPTTCDAERRGLGGSATKRRGPFRARARVPRRTGTADATGGRGPPRNSQCAREALGARVCGLRCCTCGAGLVCAAAIRVCAACNWDCAGAIRERNLPELGHRAGVHRTGTAAAAPARKAALSSGLVQSRLLSCPRRRSEASGQTVHVSRQVNDLPKHVIDPAGGRRKASEAAEPARDRNQSVANQWQIGFDWIRCRCLIS